MDRAVGDNGGDRLPVDLENHLLGGPEHAIVVKAGGEVVSEVGVIASAVQVAATALKTAAAPVAAVPAAKA